MAMISITICTPPGNRSKIMHPYSQAMLRRHWDRIEKLTGHTFEIENENFQLRNIMEAPLLEHKEDIEVC